VFEDVSDWALIEYMGEETREESAAMGRRLASVAELYSRRAREYQEAGFFLTDVTVAVAAEISPIQNISHARAVEQVRVAVTLCTRLPRIANVFAQRADRLPDGFSHFDAH
jgi:hypothetical protein